MDDVQSLEGLMAGCEANRATQAEALSDERELAEIAFALGQRTILNAEKEYPRVGWPAVPVLLHAGMRNYAAAITLALSGHPRSVVLALTRVLLESVATGLRLHQEPKLIPAWLDTKRHPKRRGPGRLFTGPMKTFGRQHGVLSALGTHPNVGMTGDGFERDPDGGTALVFSVSGVEDMACNAYYVAHTMVHLVTGAMIPLLFSRTDHPDFQVELSRAIALMEAVSRKRAKTLGRWRSFDAGREDTME